MISRMVEPMPPGVDPPSITASRRSPSRGITSAALGALLSAREIGAGGRQRAGDPLCQEPCNGMAGDPDADLSAAACETG